jgi:UDP-GlcNAc3NAcA epimerase
MTIVMRRGRGRSLHKIVASTLLFNIVGARPQFVKAAAVLRAIRSTKGLEAALVHTGQHYDAGMSQVFFDELEIAAPDYHLGIGSGGHGAQTGRMLEAIEALLMDKRPDWVFVYGDTNSTLAGALAAAKLHIPVAHIEAGLRSFNRQMPEEINRVLTDHVSDLLFAPTEAAVANLRREGIDSGKIHLTGDVMYDVALHYARKAETTRSSIIDTLQVTPGRYVLATVHRAENTDDAGRLRVIIEALRSVAGHIPVIFPIHPRTRARIDADIIRDLVAGRLQILDPVGYLDMTVLEKHAAVIATDSGGVQKEAYFYDVPCVTLRTETEWVELVHSGWNRLAPPRSAAEVVDAILAAIGSKGTKIRLYGEGHAAETIISAFRGATADRASPPILNTLS